MATALYALLLAAYGVLEWGPLAAAAVLVIAPLAAAGLGMLAERRKRRAIERMGQTIVTVPDVYPAGHREFAAVWKMCAVVFLGGTVVLMAARLVQAAVASFSGTPRPPASGPLGEVLFGALMAWAWFLIALQWKTPELRLGEHGLLLVNRFMEQDELFRWDRFTNAYFWKEAGRRWNLYLRVWPPQESERTGREEPEASEVLVLDLPPLSREVRRQVDAVLEQHVRRMPPPSER